MVTMGLQSKISSYLFEYGSYILKLIQAYSIIRIIKPVLFNRIIQLMQPENSEEDRRKEDSMAKNKLNTELVKKYQEIFHSYEREEDSGYVQVKDVPAIMKILSISITEQQILDFLGDRVNKDENPLVSAKIDFHDFLGLFIEKQAQMAMKQQLLQAFKVFDTENLGYIPVNEMRYFLRKYGITMPEDEVQDLIKDSEPEDGYIKYEKFVNKVLDLGS